MLGFNYNRFKDALRKSQEDSYQKLLLEVAKVKQTVEKLLSLALESSSNMAETNYPGVGA